MKSHNLTSARVVVHINGVKFGKVTDFGFSSSTPSKEIYSIDSSLPHELATTTTRCTVTLGLLRLAKDGGAEGAGFCVDSSEFSRGKYFGLALIDRVTDTVIFQAQHCRLTSQSWSAPARGRVTGTLEATCLEWSNEANPAPPALS
jgi:hypothetical protein